MQMMLRRTLQATHILHEAHVELCRGRRLFYVKRNVRLRPQFLEEGTNALHIRDPAPQVRMGGLKPACRSRAIMNTLKVLASRLQLEGDHSFVLI